MTIRMYTHVYMIIKSDVHVIEISASTYVANRKRINTSQKFNLKVSHYTVEAKLLVYVRTC